MKDSFRNRGWWFAAAAIAVVSLLSVGAGCGNNTIAKFEPPGTMRYDVGSRYTYEFRLLDGTRCVTRGDAITCEWRQPVVLVPRLE